MFAFHHGVDGVTDGLRRVVAQGVLLGVLFVLLEGFGEGGSVVVLLIDHTVDLPMAEEIEDIGQRLDVHLDALPHRHGGHSVGQRGLGSKMSVCEFDALVTN